MADELPAPIEDAWSDFRRSLVRRGRKAGTLEVYRKSYANFWRWATAEGIAPKEDFAIFIFNRERTGVAIARDVGRSQRGFGAALVGRGEAQGKVLVGLLAIGEDAHFEVGIDAGGVGEVVEIHFA